MNTQRKTPTGTSTAASTKEESVEPAIGDEQHNGEQEPQEPEVVALDDPSVPYSLVPVPPTRAPLSPSEIRRIGALQVEDQTDQALEQFLEEQKIGYLEQSKENLIAALLDRDKTLALEGRQLADGRIGGRLLREFVRGVLHSLDSKDPRKIEKMLQALGAEPADRRQIALHGHTLGPDTTQEERDRKFQGGA